ncbi:hypothetical protein LIT25_11455 [Bacillus sp. F19]|nr:hypothetical protein LIT25_11455 [Bacillus sp. F19]
MKFRGKKRYFRELEIRASGDQYNLDFSNDGWFDLWHTHLDFFGVGNIRPKYRREHINAHLALYNDLLKKLDSFEKPYQSWIELNEKDAAVDAVYIHTPNPNENNFPLEITDLILNSSIPDYLNGLINQEEFNVGYYKWGSDGNYIVQYKDKGITF